LPTWWEVSLAPWCPIGTSCRPWTSRAMDSLVLCLQICALPRAPPPSPAFRSTRTISPAPSRRASASFRPQLSSQETLASVELL